MEPKITDVMVLGATGFTGRLVARHLGAHPDFASEVFTFSLAGRSVDRIQQVRKDLGIDSDKVPIVQVDVLNDADVNAAVRTTKVVIDVVGPYWKWGKVVARACAGAGVHYVDLTGEPSYMKWIADECHDLAASTGAVLIPCSGFDSIPSDASVHMSNKTLKEHSPDATLDSSVTSFRMAGGISGGTFDSLFTFLDIPADDRKNSVRSFAYSPMRGVRQSFFEFTYALPLYRHITGAYYFMSVCNRLVVQRTWGLHQAELAASSDSAEAKNRVYGPKFTYKEFMTVPGGKYGAFLVSALLLACSAVLTIVPIRRFVSRYVAQPGSGPSEQTMQKGFLLATNVSTSGKDAVTGKPTYVRSIIRGRGDPGYALTAVMISESALALALEKDALPSLAKRGGVLTPMSALGDVLLRRLERTRRFDFESSIVDDDGTPV